MFIPEIIIRILSFIVDSETLKNAINYFVSEYPSLKLDKILAEPLSIYYNERDYNICTVQADLLGMKTKPILDISGNLKKFDLAPEEKVTFEYCDILMLLFLNKY